MYNILNLLDCMEGLKTGYTTQYLCQNKSLQKFWQKLAKLPIHKPSAYKVAWTVRTFILWAIR
jgi:hypothetical protein